MLPPTDAAVLLHLDAIHAFWPEYLFGGSQMPLDDVDSDL
jgi:hypothetical protein